MFYKTINTRKLIDKVCTRKAKKEGKKYSKSSKPGYKVYGLIVEDPKRDVDFSSEDYFCLITDSIIVKV